MKCKNCGVEFPEGIFCPECGTKHEEQKDELNGIFCDNDIPVAEHGNIVIEDIKVVQKQEAIPSTKGEEKYVDNTKVSKTKNSVWGIISFVFGIISIITLGAFVIPQIVGIICGIVALAQKGYKKGLAIAGLVMSVIVMIGVIVLVALALMLG